MKYGHRHLRERLHCQTHLNLEQVYLVTSVRKTVVKYPNKKWRRFLDVLWFLPIIQLSATMVAIGPAVQTLNRAHVGTVFSLYG